jgi:hypothetical protein
MAIYLSNQMAILASGKGHMGICAGGTFTRKFNS